jgi:hypothetical protein
MRVLKSFHSSTNLSKKTKIALSYGTEGVKVINCRWDQVAKQNINLE